MNRENAITPTQENIMKTLATIAIDRDYIGSDSVGKAWACTPDGAVLPTKPGTKYLARILDHKKYQLFRAATKSDATSRFRLLDDDGEVYFGGWFTDGDAGNPAEDPFTVILDWAACWAGCTRIEEKLDGEWVVVIS